MLRTMALAGLLALTANPAWAQAPKAADEATCTGEFGTSLTFEKTPSDAAKKALKAEKLVVVIHVSGNFEDPAFT